MDNINTKAARGAKWYIIASFLQKGLSVLTMIVLARILDPSIFGLFALAFVAINGLTIFKSLGFDSALIQRETDIEVATHTAFFIFPAIGITLFIITYFSAPFIGIFFENKEIIPIIRALALIFIFDCLSKTPRTILQKELRYAKISFTEMCSAAIYSLISIILAIKGFGVWSLVVGYLAKTILNTTMFWSFAKYRPKLKFNKKIALEMYHFGKFIFLGSIVFFLRQNLNNILIGKFINISAVGIFTLALNISDFLFIYFVNKIDQVMFSAFSSIQSDSRKLIKSYLDLIKINALLILPFTFSVFLLSEPLINVIYGEKWLNVIPILKILVLVGFFRSFIVASGPLFLAKGKSKYPLILSTLQITIFIIFVPILARNYGIIAVSYIVLAGSIISSIFGLLLIKKEIGIKFINIIKNIQSIIFASLVMSILISINLLIVKSILGNNYLIMLITSSIIGGSSYLLIINFLDNTLKTKLLSLIKK